MALFCFCGWVEARTYSRYIKTWQKQSHARVTCVTCVTSQSKHCAICTNIDEFICSSDRIKFIRFLSFSDIISVLAFFCSYSMLIKLHLLRYWKYYILNSNNFFYRFRNRIKKPNSTKWFLKKYNNKMIMIQTTSHTLLIKAVISATGTPLFPRENKQAQPLPCPIYSAIAN